ncbi:hypothetical protein CHS0354_009260 [Potamilus streckersoni]|uniref:Uncharacterized protein n=1 Tax=Potamilus streckersoni TaxID=2493646 RepID=A0AAE0SJ10_9BIVA|nr:hypothetical protein CHS0354_009260 [Potamilus streckersoni]
MTYYDINFKKQFSKILHGMEQLIRYNYQRCIDLRTRSQQVKCTRKRRNERPELLMVGMSAANNSVCKIYARVAFREKEGEVFRLCNGDCMERTLNPSQNIVTR